MTQKIAMFHFSKEKIKLQQLSDWYNSQKTYYGTDSGYEMPQLQF